jgi:hypothetical protein
VGDAVRSKKVMLFVDTRGGKDAGYAVCNPSPTTAAALTVELKKLDGTPAAPAVNRSLPAFNQRAEYVTETFASTNLSEFVGVLVVSCAETEVAVTTLRTRGVQFTSLPSAPEVVTTGQSQNHYFARLADGLIGSYVYRGSFVFLNNSARAANITLDLLTSDGKPGELVLGGIKHSKFAFQAPAGSAVELTSDGSSAPAFIGWAKAASDTPVTATGTFEIREAAGAFVNEVGVPSSPASTKVSIHAQVTDQTDTGFALSSTATWDTTVTLRLVSTTPVSAALSKPGKPLAPSRVVASKTLNLAAGSATARYISEFFSDVPEVNSRNFEGRVEAEGWDRLAALTLRTRGVYLTSLPVAPFTTTAFAPKLTLIPSTTLEGSRPCVCARLTQAGNEAPVRSAVIRLNKGSVDFTKITEPGQRIGNLLSTVLGTLYLGRIFVSVYDGSSAEFFTAVTVDGEEEAVLFLGTLRNLPGEGFEFSVESNPLTRDKTFSYSAAFCLDPELVRLPTGATTINVSQEFTSFEQTPAEGDTLARTAASQIITSAFGATAPRIDFVTPTRTVAAGEIVIKGANFSSTPADNLVTVAGSRWTRQPAAVLEAAVDRLRVRLPEDTVSGSLQVARGGESSNNYTLDIPFAPRPTIVFGSLTGGAETTLKLSVATAIGQAWDTRWELPLMEFTAKPSQGTWKTGGFSVGSVIGKLTILSGMWSRTVFDLKVKSSDADKLVVDVIEQGESSVSYTVELSNSPQPRLAVASPELGSTSVLSIDTTLEFDFTEAVFKMPGGAGTAFDVVMDFVSMPERTMLTPTSLTAQRIRSFTTS